MELTRKQAQFLKNNLSKQLCILEDMKSFLKKEVAICYDYCDVDKKEETSAKFQELNAYKDAIRSVRKRQASLSEIQRQVKKFLSQ